MSYLHPSPRAPDHANLVGILFCFLCLCYSRILKIWNVFFFFSLLRRHKYIGTVKFKFLLPWNFIKNSRVKEFITFRPFFLVGKKMDNSHEFFVTSIQADPWVVIYWWYNGRHIGTNVPRAIKNRLHQVVHSALRMFKEFVFKFLPFIKWHKLYKCNLSLPLQLTDFLTYTIRTPPGQ